MTTSVAKVADPSHMPVVTGIFYIIFTITLFVLGPFDWPLPTLGPVLGYLFLLLLALACGHVAALGRPARHAPLGSAKLIILLGAVAAIGLLAPSSIIYTGRWPWQVLEALQDQREAYSRLREQLIETEGGRGLIIAARMLTYPLLFAVIPLGVIYWRSLGTAQRALVLLTALSSLIFSVLRGTTRELADLFIVAGSALLVSFYRRPGAGSVLRQNWRKILLIAAAAVGVIFVLVARTEARMADVQSATEICMGEGRVCPDFYSSIYAELPAPVSGAIATITGYFAQGYYGLGLALEKEWVPTWGIGHSPALQTLYTMFTGDDRLPRLTYTARLSEEGWSGDYYWSSLPTWLASDISFWMVPILFLLLGFIWGRSWVDATVGQDDRAAVLFCAMMMMIFYFPANNQMMNTLDNYAAFVGWLLIWGLTRSRALRIARS